MYKGVGWRKYPPPPPAVMRTIWGHALFCWTWFLFSSDRGGHQAKVLALDYARNNSWLNCLVFAVLVAIVGKL